MDRLGRLTIGSLAGAAALATPATVGPLPTLAVPASGVLVVMLLVAGTTGTCVLCSALGVDTN